MPASRSAAAETQVLHAGRGTLVTMDGNSHSRRPRLTEDEIEMGAKLVDAMTLIGRVSSRTCSHGAVRLRSSIGRVYAVEGLAGADVERERPPRGSTVVRSSPPDWCSGGLCCRLRCRFLLQVAQDSAKGCAGCARAPMNSAVSVQLAA